MDPNGAVLLVEDDDDLREILCRRLRRRGLIVVVAGNRRVALSAVATQRFQIAVIDRTLSDSVGWELIETLKQFDAEMQIIAMSGSCDEESMDLARRMGACDYLVKPFALSDLEVAIERATHVATVASPE